MLSRSDLDALIESGEIDTVIVAFCDMQGRLTGKRVASRLFVSARTSGAVGDRKGISLFVIAPQQPGVKIERTSMLDSRNASRCTFEAVEVPETALLGTLDLGADLLDPVLDRAAVCLSAEILGLITQAYETTLEYLKTL